MGGAVARAGQRELGLRLIVGYKLLKAGVELAAAAVLLVLAATGGLARVDEFAIELRHEVTSRWALLAGGALQTIFSARGVRLVELGLAVDGVVSAVEGWSLWRGYRWSSWLVIVTTGLPVPLEILEIVRRPTPLRLALAVVNAAIVVYLARRTGKHRLAREEE